MDPIANMLTTIRNSVVLRKEQAKIPFSSFKIGILEILKKHQYVKDFEIAKEENNRKFIKINFSYENKMPKLQKIKLISKQGRKVYVKAKNIPRTLGILIISTPKGLIDDKEAKKNNLGGELICEVI